MGVDDLPLLDVFLANVVAFLKLVVEFSEAWLKPRQPLVDVGWQEVSFGANIEVGFEKSVGSVDQLDLSLASIASLVHVHDVVQGDEVGLVVHVENRRFDVLGFLFRFSK